MRAFRNGLWSESNIKHIKGVSSIEAANFINQMVIDKKYNAVDLARKIRKGWATTASNFHHPEYTWNRITFVKNKTSGFDLAIVYL